MVGVIVLYWGMKGDFDCPTASGKGHALRTALIALILLMLSHAFGQTAEVQAGDFIFKPLPKWQRVDEGGVTALNAPSSTKDKVTTILLFTREGGAFRDNFDREWGKVKLNYTVQKQYDVTSTRNNNGLEMLATQGALTDKSGGLWIAQMMCIQFGQRFEFIMFLSNEFQSASFADSTAALKGLLGSVHFAAPPTTAANGTSSGTAGTSAQTSGNNISGVYRSVLAARSFTVGVNSTTPASLVYKYATFFADGMFSQGQPEGGLEGYDRAGEIRFNPVGWGRYQMAGNEGRVVFNKTDQYETEPIVWGIRRTAAGLVINKWEYRLLDPSDGLRLQGMYRRADNNPYAAHAITFTADGRFSDQGVLKDAAVMRRDVRGGLQNDDGAPGSGTYFVGNYTLRLNYSDGRVKRVFFVLGDGATKGDPRKIEINTYAFSRQ